MPGLAFEDLFFQFGARNDFQFYLLTKEFAICFRHMGPHQHARRTTKTTDQAKAKRRKIQSTRCVEVSRTTEKMRRDLVATGVPFQIKRAQRRNQTSDSWIAYRDENQVCSSYCNATNDAPTPAICSPGFASYVWQAQRGTVLNACRNRVTLTVSAV